MDIESLFGFIATHIYLVSGSIILMCLLLLIPILSYSIRRGESTATVDFGDLSSLEGALKRVLEETGSTPAVVRVAAKESADVAVNTIVTGEGVSAEIQAQIVELKAKNKTLQESIANFESAQANPGSSPARLGGTTAELAAASASAKALLLSEDRIKELEARLREYEIIEDDIADLSSYKEENAQLKIQIEKARTLQAAAVAAPAVAAAVAPVAPVLTTPIPDIVPKLAVVDVPEVRSDDEEDELERRAEELALNAAATREEAEALFTNTNVGISQDDLDALLATAEPENTKPENTKPENTKPENTEPENTEPAITALDNVAELFADTAAESAEAPSVTPVAEIMEGINSDTLLSELAALESLPDTEDRTALEEDIDTDRLLDEAIELPERKKA